MGNIDTFLNISRYVQERLPRRFASCRWNPGEGP